MFHGTQTESPSLLITSSQDFRTPLPLHSTETQSSAQTQGNGNEIIPLGRISNKEFEAILIYRNTQSQRKVKHQLKETLVYKNVVV